MPVSREKKKWGHRRLAVEGEIIDKTPSFFSQRAVIIASCEHVLYNYFPTPLSIKSASRGSRFELWLETVCCILGQDTLLSQCLSPSSQVINWRLSLSFESLVPGLFSINVGSVLLFG